MTTKEIIDELAEYDDDTPILLADGFEDALLGAVVGGHQRQPLACYDYDKCIEILMTRDGMSYEEAEEFFDLNTVGADVGESTPVFLHNLRDRTI